MLETRGLRLQLLTGARVRTEACPLLIESDAGSAGDRPGALD